MPRRPGRRGGCRVRLIDAGISDDEALRGWLALNSGARGSLGH